MFQAAEGHDSPVFRFQRVMVITVPSHHTVYRDVVHVAPLYQWVLGGYVIAYSARVHNVRLVKLPNKSNIS